MSVCSCYVLLWIFISLNVLCYGLRSSTRLDVNSANTDFLLTEAGRNSAFPALGTPAQTQSGNDKSSNKVHDLVNFYNKQASTKAPSYSSIASGTKPQSVATKPSSSSITQSTVVTNPVTPANKLGSSPSPNQYIPNNPLTPAKKPSWSNVVSGGKDQPPSPKPSKDVRNNNAAPIAPLNPSSLSPSKPSWSTVVSGNNKKQPPLHIEPNAPNGSRSPQAPSNPTTKPIATVAGGNPSPTPTVKPIGAPILPSAILNNNNQNNRPVNSNAPTDIELQTLSEELLRKDNNNAAKLITINYQGKTTSQSKNDMAPLPLLAIPDSVWSTPTVQKFIPLLDNYERDTLVNEYVTPQERNEENAFMDVIMVTPVIRQLMNFLKEKGYVTPDPRQQRDFLKQLWFNLYSRGKGKISSSGFEHVFVSELKNGEVSGLHNWIYFAREESANRANYLGYLKYEQLNDKGTVMKFHFNQQGVDKPVDSLFIGTSPELEMALYSLCFITRADQDCRLKLGGKDVNIITHTFRYRSKNMIGSAYPQI